MVTRNDGKLATVFGGTGFIGRYVVRDLAKAGYTIRVATRAPADAAFLRPAGRVGQINPVGVSLHDRQSIATAIGESALVVNLIGALTESRRHSFEFLHAEVPGRIARAAANVGARMIHFSAIGADVNSKSAYAASKGHGEAQVREALLGATLLRPSIVFGPEDEFFNRFASMVQLAPALPLIGGGKTLFQPVYVGDIAQAVRNCTTDEATLGATYELGGSQRYSFRQLMELMLHTIGRRRVLLPIPFGIARFQARFLELVPGKPLTRDQVQLLKADNVTAPGAPGLSNLGVTSTALELILPTYMDRFRKGGRFHDGAHGESLYS